jgi:HEPN domain-containing protein
MREEVERWLEKADEDLETAKYNLRGKMLNAAIFYSQQATEKALKALQIKKLNKFEKIHDLVKLAESVDANKRILDLCDQINPVYSVSRYPDVIGNKYSREEVEEILKSSKKVLEWVKEEIQS